MNSFLPLLGATIICAGSAMSVSRAHADAVTADAGSTSLGHGAAAPVVSGSFAFENDPNAGGIMIVNAPPGTGKASGSAPVPTPTATASAIVPTPVAIHTATTGAMAVQATPVPVPVPQMTPPAPVPQSNLVVEQPATTGPAQVTALPATVQTSRTAHGNDVLVTTTVTTTQVTHLQIPAASSVPGHPTEIAASAIPSPDHTQVRHAASRHTPRVIAYAAHRAGGIWLVAKRRGGNAILADLDTGALQVDPVQAASVYAGRATLLVDGHIERGAGRHLPTLIPVGIAEVTPDPPLSARIRAGS